LCKVGTVHFLNDFEVIPEDFFSISIHGLGVKPCHLNHKCALNKDKPGTEHIGLVNVMLSKPGAAVNYMGFPQDGREVLGGASDSGHGESLPVFIGGVVEVVFALPEVDEFEFALLCDEDVGWLDVAVADAFALQEGTGGDEGAVKFEQLFFSPVQVLFLAFAVQVLQVHVSVHVLCDDAQLVRVVLGFAQVVT
jgi:hypothetical protein